MSGVSWQQRRHRPGDGSDLLDGEEITGRDLDDLASVGTREIGFIFQGFNLGRRVRAHGRGAEPEPRLAPPRPLINRSPPVGAAIAVWG